MGIPRKNRHNDLFYRGNGLLYRKQHDSGFVRQCLLGFSLHDPAAGGEGRRVSIAGSFRGDPFECRPAFFEARKAERSSCLRFPGGCRIPAASRHRINLLQCVSNYLIII